MPILFCNKRLRQNINITSYAYDCSFDLDVHTSGPGFELHFSAVHGLGWSDPTISSKALVGVRISKLVTDLVNVLGHADSEFLESFVGSGIGPGAEQMPPGTLGRSFDRFLV